MGHWHYRSCCHCCCTGRREGKDGVVEGSKNTSRPGSKYKCLRKFLAITCSQLGLLVLIVLYLIGGTFLFTYLEREHHQTRMNLEVSQVRATYEELLGGWRRVRRSSNGQVTGNSRQLGLFCVDLQLETLQNEIERLKKSIRSDKLQARAIELAETRQEVDDLIALGQTQMLNDILTRTADINVTSQIRGFEMLTLSTKHRQTPETADSSRMLNNFIRSVYEAIRAGWVPPPPATAEKLPHLTSSPSSADVEHPMPRGRSKATSQESILKSRTPRTDPWTLSGSLFYVITVITTIGYGQVVPVTKYGRLATIFYGLFGIPMMLLFLTNLGSLMADVFRILYKKLCCHFVHNGKRDSPLPMPSTSAVGAEPLDLSGPNKPRANTSTPPLPLRNTPGRANFGNSSSPRLGGDKKMSALEALVRKTTPLPGVTESLFITLAGSNSVFTRALQARKESRNVRVPVWLSLCIFLLYLVMGALVFAYWEQWTILDAMYFVFVTVSTIGFGDMIPGIDDPHPVHRLNKFIVANVYLLVGLAMVAMCFDLMQLEVKRRSKRLARRIGLISSM